MPSTAVEVEVAAPIAEAWRFVTDFSNWATLMPGYQSHQPMDGLISIWTLKSDAGIFQRTVLFRVDITERQEPERIAFLLTAASENLEGSGSFTARAVSAHQTAVTLQLSMSMKGMLAPVGNALLEKMLPRDAQTLTAAVRTAIERRLSV